MGRKLPLVIVPLLTVSAVVYPLAPNDTMKAEWLSVVGFAAMIFAFVGLAVTRPALATAWTMVLVGYAMWVVADLVTDIEQMKLHLQYYPVPSDAVYLAAYVVLAVGFLMMVRSTQVAPDRTILLDAAIVTTGTGVVAAVFLIDPIVHDSSLTAAGQIVSSAYPLADVLLIGILVRIWASPVGRTRAANLLVGALGFTMLADVVWDVIFLTTGRYDSGVSNQLYMASYITVAAAAWSSPTRRQEEKAPLPLSQRSMRPRLILLSSGLALPAATLTVDGVIESDPLLVVVGLGSLLLVGMVLARMFGLLKVVEAMAKRLSGLARSDGLTGAPNRRTWDYELLRACQTARESGQPLSVGLLDLDHFKAFNDRHGHQAGDRLLREAVSVWTEALGDQGFLARYGGEEFAVLLPGRTPREALALMNRLRELTPEGESFSAGIAQWNPTTEPPVALAAADAAMYQAKRAGRDQVILSLAGAAPMLPVPTIAFQPIVDLTTGKVVAHEALSRFDGQPPRGPFATATTNGQGPQLQGQAILAALSARRPGQVVALNVSLDALSTPSLLRSLPDDLDGVILEITEDADWTKDSDPGTLIAELRARGCRFAIDDWGQGYSNLERLLRLRPELVKLDIELVRNIASPDHRAVIQAIVSWARELGALVCGEGIETVEERDGLTALGVQLGQGFLLGRPEFPLPDVVAPEFRLPAVSATPVPAAI